MGVALPVLSIVTTVAGAALSAYGSYQQGKAQEKMYDYEAQVEKNKAQAATEQGEAQAQQVGLVNREKMGAITAGEAASGVDVNTGSAGQVRQSARLLGQTDVEQARANAAYKAYGFNTQSTLDTFAGKNAMYQGKMGMFSSLLSGAASVTGDLMKYQDAAG